MNVNFTLYVKGMIETVNVKKNNNTQFAKEYRTSFGRIDFSQNLNTNILICLKTGNCIKKRMNISQLTIVHVNMSMRTKQ